MVLDNTGLVTQLSKKAQENKENLVMLWVTSQTPMDPSNKMVEEALHRQHIPV